jgi:hypothetical protein
MQMLTEQGSQIFLTLEAVSACHCYEICYHQRDSLVFLSRSRLVSRYSLRVIYDRFTHSLFQFSIHYHQSVLYSFS